MGAIWLGSWLGQSITGRVAFNADRFDHRQDAVSWLAYLGTPDFWNRTLQNWHATAGDQAIVVDLRQRTFVDSSGVRALLRLHTSARARLTVIPGPPNVQRVFELAGLTAALPVRI